LLSFKRTDELDRTARVAAAAVAAVLPLLCEAMQRPRAAMAPHARNEIERACVRSIATESHLLQLLLDRLRVAAILS